MTKEQFWQKWIPCDRSPFEPSAEIKEEFMADLAAVQPEENTLLSALKELSAMYGHAWDQVDGGLVMMGSSIERFEAAHDKARAAIEAAEAPRPEEREPVPCDSGIWVCSICSCARTAHRDIEAVRSPQKETK